MNGIPWCITEGYGNSLIRGVTYAVGNCKLQCDVSIPVELHYAYFLWEEDGRMSDYEVVVTVHILMQSSNYSLPVLEDLEV